MFKFIVNFYKNLKYYFKNISIHGLCTIFRGTYWPEMIFWIVIFLISVQYFCALIIDNLISFYSQPVTRSIDTTAYPINLIPFPAITVCNFNTIYKSRAEFMIKLLVKNGVTEDDAINFFNNLPLLRNPMPVEIEPFKKIYKILAQNGYTDDSVWMENLAQPCSRLLEYCKWNDREQNCTELFGRTKGDFGFCCSFNSYFDVLNDTDYFTSAGVIHGLYLKFNLDVEEYMSPTFNVTGVIVLVHNKETFPTSDTVLLYAIAEPGKHVSLKIIPKIINVEELVNTLPVNARQCYFENEGTRYKNMNYTFENCMDICKSEAIAKLCGCIPYYFQNTGKWRDCSLLDMPCLVSNFERYSALQLKLDTNRSDRNKKNTSMFCECYPRCSGISYSGVIEDMYYKNEKGEIETNNTSASIFFRSNWCYKYTASRSMTFESFIASVGGFFSLCMGGSILSICEFIYYFLKSLFVKSDNENKDDKEYFPELYWKEIRTNSLKPVKYNKNIVIFHSQITYLE